MDTSSSEEGEFLSQTRSHLLSMPPQCNPTVYSLIKDDTRLTSNGGGGQNDYNFITKDFSWYRFVSESGYPLIIPQSKPARERCGTVEPGWMSFSLPNHAGDTTSGRFCFVAPNLSCDRWVDGQATNCDDIFYVFYTKK